MNANNDFDQQLLHQFSCLGTTDKADLVKQLQELLAGCHVSGTTASFFLDMNNWNLQAAICSYIDCNTPMNVPSVTILNNSMQTGDPVPPNTKFSHVWQLQNSGSESWPSGLMLHLTKVVDMDSCAPVPVPALGPNERTDISVILTSPAVPGIYNTIWQIMTPWGTGFGESFAAFVTVRDYDAIDLTKQLQQLSTSEANTDKAVRMWL